MVACCDYTWDVELPEGESKEYECYEEKHGHTRNKGDWQRLVIRGDENDKRYFVLWVHNGIVDIDVGARFKITRIWRVRWSSRKYMKTWLNTVEINADIEVTVPVEKPLDEELTYRNPLFDEDEEMPF